MLKLLLILHGSLAAVAVNFNYSILPEPVWGFEDCPRTFPTFNTSSCDIIPENGKYEIIVNLFLPNSLSYIVNFQKGLEIVKQAEEHARNLGLLKNIIFNYSVKDDMCNSEKSTIHIIQAFKENCARVVFGLPCEYCLASVARVAKYLGNYGTLIFAPIALTYDFTDKKNNMSDQFYGIINTGPADYRSYAEFFHLILNAHGWKKIALVFDRDAKDEVSGENSCKLFLETVVREITKKETVNYISADVVLTGISYKKFFESQVGNDYAIIVSCTNQKKFRKLILDAYDLNMMKRGEYIFFNFELYNEAPIPAEPWVGEDDDVTTNEKIKEAYKSVYTFTPIYETKFNMIRNESRTRGQIYLDGLYNAMLIYSEIMTKAIEENDTSSLHGYNLINNMMGRNFTSNINRVNETIRINCNAQRANKIALLNLVENKYKVVGVYNNEDKQISDWEVRWPSDNPSDTPKCGFDLAKCPTYDKVKVLVISLVTVISTALLIVAVLFYRHVRYKKLVYARVWKVDEKEVVSHKRRSSYLSTASYKSCETISIVGQQQIFTDVAYYKTAKVCIKKLSEEKYDFSHEQLVELKELKDMDHNNIAKFYGACLESPNYFILTEYCSRGSLQDILENTELILDWNFKMSFIMDIVRGMLYIHSSNSIKFHGSLKSSNCLVDGRFIVKISDFGIKFIRKHIANDNQESSDHAFWRRQLWTAPELLRSFGGTQKGDVYSFAIIMHEIIMRQGVFHLGEQTLSPKEIVEAVRKGPDANNGQTLRPLIQDGVCEDEVTQLMSKCWAEDAADRPDFSHLKKTLRQMNKQNDCNLLDDLLQRMEQYANNLETLVEERTSDYLEEKRKCEELLYQLLPKSVAQQLITGRSVIAETFDQVTIYFSDIVGFTALSAQSTPLQVVDLLNDLYTCFDSILGNFDVYKVETIGDAYMVVSGLPERNGDKHAREIARMSLALLKAVKQFQIRHRPQDPLQLRIGIHTGPCVAGVVGLKMPRYCLFGDTVNTASRMESNGLPLKIHVSSETKDVLDTFGTFYLERRGEVEMKGKGKMVTYWLNGEREEYAAEHPQLEKKAYRIPSTPIPHNVRKEMVAGGKVANVDQDLRRGDEAEVPLLSISTPQDLIPPTPARI